jgi:hypothetical protein
MVKVLGGTNEVYQIALTDSTLKAFRTEEMVIALLFSCMLKLLCSDLRASYHLEQRKR